MKFSWRIPSPAHLRKKPPRERGGYHLLKLLFSMSRSAEHAQPLVAATAAKANKAKTADCRPSDWTSADDGPRH
jgi:hypothetical protein